MHEHSASGRAPANRAMAGTVGLLVADPRAEYRALLHRIAAGVRALPPDIPRLPTLDDRARVRAEFDRAVARLRAANIEVVPGVG